jgi:hypothetical protein
VCTAIAGCSETPSRSPATRDAQAGG